MPVQWPVVILSSIVKWCFDKNMHSENVIRICASSAFHAKYNTYLCDSDQYISGALPYRSTIYVRNIKYVRLTLALGLTAPSSSFDNILSLPNPKLELTKRAVVFSNHKHVSICFFGGTDRLVLKPKAIFFFNVTNNAKFYISSCLFWQ